MRTALAAALSLSFTAAVAQDVTVEGAARTVTSFIAIKSTCGKLMAIDQDIATKYATAAIRFGEQSYGKQAFSQALARDIERRRSEVNTTGPKQWCTYQRGYLRSIGMMDIFLD